MVIVNVCFHIKGQKLSPLTSSLTKIPRKHFSSEGTPNSFNTNSKNPFVVCLKKLNYFASKIIENFASMIKLFPFPFLKMLFLKSFNGSDFSK